MGVSTNGASTDRRFGQPRVGVHVQHAHGGGLPRGLARLAHGLAEAGAAGGALLVDQPALVLGGRPERLHLQRHRLGGRGQLGQLGAERQPDPLRVGAGDPQRGRLAPGAAGHEARRHRQRPQRPAAPLAARQHAGDQHLQRALELLAGDRLGQIDPLGHRLRRAARLERGVAPAGEVERQQAGVAEALGHRARGQRRQLAEGAHPQAVEHLGQGAQLGARAQQRRGQPGEKAGGLALARPPRARAAAAPRARRNRRRSDEGAAPIRLPRPSERRVAASTPARSPPWMPRRPSASKKAAPACSDSGAPPIRSILSSTSCQRLRTASGSGGTSRSSGQRDSASPSRMPAITPKASAGAEASPTICSRPASGASATGSAEQRPPIPQRGQQGESGDQDTDDHRRTHVRIWRGGAGARLQPGRLAGIDAGGLAQARRVARLQR